MFNKIILGIGAILTFTVAILYALLGKEKAQRKQAETVAEVYKDATIENVKEIERVKQAEKVRNDVKLSSNDDVTNELLKYARDRHKD